MTSSNPKSPTFIDDLDSESKSGLVELRQLALLSPTFDERLFYSIQLAVIETSNAQINLERKRINGDLIASDYAGRLAHEVATGAASGLFSLVSSMTRLTILPDVLAACCQAMGERLNFLTTQHIEETLNQNNSTPDIIIPDGSKMQ